MGRRRREGRKKGRKAPRAERQTVIASVFFLFNFMLQISSVIINHVGEEMVYITFSCSDGSAQHYVGGGAHVLEHMGEAP